MLKKDTNLIIGKINSGKTRGVLLQEVKRAIENHENLIILDNKEEYYGTFYEELKNKGYNIHVLNLKNVLYSNGFNPLLLPYHFYKEGNYDLANELIRILALEIFKEDFGNTDPFWANSAADYFLGLTLILFKEGKEEEINLGSIGTMISQTEDIGAYLKKLNPLDPIYITTSVTAFAPSETKASIISVMRQKLNTIYMRPNLLSLLCANEIDLTNLKDKTAVFVIGEEAKNVVANIFINEFIITLKNNKISYNFILDNFDTLPVLLEFKSLVKNATHYNLKVNVAIRDLEAAEDKYGKYVFKNFQDVIEIKESDLLLLEVGKTKDYPKFKTQEQKYFNFKK